MVSGYKNNPAYHITRAKRHCNCKTATGRGGGLKPTNTTQIPFSRCKSLIVSQNFVFE